MAKFRDKKTGRFIVAQSNEEKFWEKVKFDFKTGCLEWIGYKDKLNYKIVTGKL